MFRRLYVADLDVRIVTLDRTLLWHLIRDSAASLPAERIAAV
jgi:hypothetical protein